MVLYDSEIRVRAAGGEGWFVAQSVVPTKGFPFLVTAVLTPDPGKTILVLLVILTTILVLLVILTNLECDLEYKY